MFKVTRHCAGEYTVHETSNSDRKIRIVQVYYPGDGKYWIAAAQWDRYLYTDPLATKRDAVLAAKEMLNSK